MLVSWPAPVGIVHPHLLREHLLCRHRVIWVRLHPTLTVLEAEEATTPAKAKSTASEGNELAYTLTRCCTKAIEGMFVSLSPSDCFTG